MGQAPQPAVDRWLLRLVVIILGVVPILALASVFWLRLNEHEIPDAIIAFGSSAPGAIAGLLTPTAR